MTPSEIANNALNATLEAVQSMMKHCMKLKEDDPVTLTLSDEITRRVAKDLKLHGGSATLFSPQLLSCAAVVRQYSKAGTFVSLPNWNSVVNNYPHIKTHPQFHKTVDYRPSLASANAEPEPTTLSSVVLVNQPSATLTLTKMIPAVRPELLTSMEAPHPVQLPYTILEVQPSAPAVLVTELLISDIQSTVTATEVQEPLAPLPPSIASTTVRHNIFVAGNIKMEAKATMPLPTKTKKRKAEADDSDPVLPPVSQNGVEDIGISTIGRQWTHAWDPSVVTGVQDEVEMSASATRNGDALDSPVLQADSIASSRLSSTPSAISDK
ncbi:hypothetical protein F4604DRAFT_1937496 [Suillus subluteus]|nr:hypothetical protein F4604DRAFT_1937496 [Suillus subluteus]